MTLSTAATTTPLYILHTVKSLLVPIGPDVLESLVARLWHQHDYPQPEKSAAISSLTQYPEDLVCAAYHHAMRSASGNSDELIGNMIHFMEPELNYRRSRYQHLLSLQEEMA